MNLGSADSLPALSLLASARTLLLSSAVCRQAAQSPRTTPSRALNPTPAMLRGAAALRRPLLAAPLRCLLPRAPARALAWTPQHAAFPRRTAAELYAEIRELTKPGGDFTIHNYVRRPPAPATLSSRPPLLPAPALTTDVPRAGGGD